MGGGRWPCPVSPWVGACVPEGYCWAHQQHLLLRKPVPDYCLMLLLHCWCRRMAPGAAPWRGSRAPLVQGRTPRPPRTQVGRGKAEGGGGAGGREWLHPCVPRRQLRRSLLYPADAGWNTLTIPTQQKGVDRELAALAACQTVTLLLPQPPPPTHPGACPPTHLPLLPSSSHPPPSPPLPSSTHLPLLPSTHPTIHITSCCGGGAREPVGRGAPHD